jgi:hypothetical protein
MVSTTETNIAVSSGDRNAGDVVGTKVLGDHPPAQPGRAIMPAEAAISVLIVFLLFIAVCEFPIPEKVPDRIKMTIKNKQTIAAVRGTDNFSVQIDNKL